MLAASSRCVDCLGPSGLIFAVELEGRVACLCDRCLHGWATSEDARRHLTRYLRRQADREAAVAAGEKGGAA